VLGAREHLTRRALIRDGCSLSLLRLRSRFVAGSELPLASTYGSHDPLPRWLSAPRSSCSSHRPYAPRCPLCSAPAHQCSPLTAARHLHAAASRLCATGLRLFGCNAHRHCGSSSGEKLVLPRRVSCSCAFLLSTGPPWKYCRTTLAVPRATEADAQPAVLATLLHSQRCASKRSPHEADYRARITGSRDLLARALASHGLNRRRVLPRPRATDAPAAASATVARAGRASPRTRAHSGNPPLQSLHCR